LVSFAAAMLLAGAFDRPVEQETLEVSLHPSPYLPGRTARYGLF